MKKYSLPKSKIYAKKESNRFMYLLGFLIPLYSLSIIIFVEWSWYKLIPFILLIAIFSRSRRKCPPRKDIFQWTVILICFMFVITLINYFLNIQSGRFQYAVEAGQNYLRTYGQMIVQYFMIVMSLTQLFLFSYFIKSKKSVDMFFDGFIVGNIISVVVGFLQYVAFKLNVSLEWLNVHSFQSSLGGYFRMSGLGGEPRHFSAFISLGLLILIANYLANRPIAIKIPLAKSGILAAGLFFSLSTSAWLGFLGGLLVIGLISLDSKKTWLLITISFCLIVLLASSNNFITIIHERFFSRMISFDYFMYFAPKDGIVLKLISNSLRICLIGTGSGGSDFYVMNPKFLDTVPDVILKAGIIKSVYEGTVINSLSPSSFFLKFWAEYGIVGIILLLILVRAVVRRIRIFPQYSRFILLISPAIFVASIPSSMLIVYVYFTVLSILYGFYYHLSKQQVMSKEKF